MNDPFFDFFNKDRPVVDQESPEWKIVSFKEYPRSPRILLPKPARLKTELSDVILKRKTEREFSDLPLSKEVLGTLLFWSMGLIHKSPHLPAGRWGDKSEDRENILRRPYPSGGARYPVESYVIVFRGENLARGAYHYNFKEHALEEIQRSDIGKIQEALPYDFAKNASALILLSFIGERTVKKYGNLGYKLGLLEAGHIGQNIYLVGAALGLGVLALGGIDYEVIQKELDLGEEETVFYQLSLGWLKEQPG
ncbi:MAG: SagB/ThcOx family dehydrogenase [Candidatus Azambacteria bacterium]|nr:SagB/ThcOx family dehydrogenase [Candidatus Azambacteria bacterium]